MKQKVLFYILLLLLVGTEFYRNYLIMPMPGSQHESALSVSYPLYEYRWWIRIVLLLGIVWTARSVFEKRRWIPVTALLFSGGAMYLLNFVMSADRMFYEPETLQFTDADSSGLPHDALVISVSIGREAHAYPIRYLAYHHKVQDVIDGQTVMVSYCNVCRSALAFDPKVEGEYTRFRLVGMDQFNAMIEDDLTGSWWQQATGECVAGERKGDQLYVLSSQQLSLSEWKSLYPYGKVMLPDPAFIAEYSDDQFEKGTSTSSLVGTDTTSWGEKSWVVGVEHKGFFRAYDWNELKRKRTIEDTLGRDKVVLTIDAENINYYVAIYSQESPVTFDGTDSVENFGYHPGTTALPIAARQMFWHTWRTFYPQTTRYGIR